jgi:hypothetical protein
LAEEEKFCLVMAVPDTLEILCMCALQRKTNKEEAYAKVIITYVIFMI